VQNRRDLETVRGISRGYIEMQKVQVEDTDREYIETPKGIEQ